MKRPVISLLTDFGSSDHYVGAMKGVMLGICPEAQLVDITHEIGAYAIAQAAFTISQAWPCFPAGTVHLIVVDPGVGSARRPILAEARGHYFVAPDNGVLSLVKSAARDFRARQISAERFYRKPVSRTFHGRDIFAPVAAHLAAGVPAGEFGGTIDDLVVLPMSRARQTGPETWSGIVLRIDRFGNIVTSFESDSFEEGRFEVMVGGQRITRFHADYAAAEAGEIFLIHGSSGYIEISINQADAAKVLGVSAGDEVRLLLLSGYQYQEHRESGY
jgi:hypothetical protein